MLLPRSPCWRGGGTPHPRASPILVFVKIHNGRSQSVSGVWSRALWSQEVNKCLLTDRCHFLFITETLQGLSPPVSPQGPHLPPPNPRPRQKTGDNLWRWMVCVGSEPTFHLAGPSPAGPSLKELMESQSPGQQGQGRFPPSLTPPLTQG